MTQRERSALQVFSFDFLFNSLFFDLFDVICIVSVVSALFTSLHFWFRARMGNDYDLSDMIRDVCCSVVEVSDP